MNRDQEVNQKQNRRGQQQPSRRSRENQQGGIIRNPDEREQPSNPVEKNEQLDKDGSPGGANG